MRPLWLILSVCRPSISCLSEAAKLGFLRFDSGARIIAEDALPRDRRSMGVGFIPKNF